jgi:hypothetical protein
VQADSRAGCKRERCGRARCTHRRRWRRIAASAWISRWIL